MNAVTAITALLYTRIERLAYINEPRTVIVCRQVTDLWEGVAYYSPKLIVTAQNKNGSVTVTINDQDRVEHTATVTEEDLRYFIVTKTGELVRVIDDDWCFTHDKFRFQLKAGQPLAITMFDGTDNKLFAFRTDEGCFLFSTEYAMIPYRSVLPKMEETLRKVCQEHTEPTDMRPSLGYAHNMVHNNLFEQMEVQLTKGALIDVDGVYYGAWDEITVDKIEVRYIIFRVGNRRISITERGQLGKFATRLIDPAQRVTDNKVRPEFIDGVLCGLSDFLPTYNGTYPIHSIVISSQFDI
jgi:hypothetical protein